MATHFGTVPVGSVLPVHFGSYGAAAESVTLTDLAVTDIEIYKGATVTQRASDAGIALIDTDGIDIDGLVGANGFSIDTGDDTDAGFYAVGAFFNVWVASVTIQSQTVNFLAATFRLSPSEAVAGVPRVDLTHIAGVADPASRLAKTMGAVIRGTAQASGSSTTLIATSAFGISGAGAADQFVGREVLFDEDTTTSTLRGVVRSISASTASATPVLTVATMPATPQDGDTFSVI